MTDEAQRIAEGQWPMCSECGEERATDVDELCDRCAEGGTILERQSDGK